MLFLCAITCVVAMWWDRLWAPDSESDYVAVDTPAEQLEFGSDESMDFDSIPADSFELPAFFSTHSPDRHSTSGESVLDEPLGVADVSFDFDELRAALREDATVRQLDAPSSGILAPATGELVPLVKPRGVVFSKVEQEALLKDVALKWWFQVALRARDTSPLLSSEDFRQLERIRGPERVVGSLWKLAVGSLYQYGGYWHRYERWIVVQGGTVFPPSSFVLADFFFEQLDGGCGPTVATNFRHAINFVCDRLQFPMVAESSLVTGVEDLIKQSVRLPVKKAPAFGKEQVRKLEGALGDRSWLLHCAPFERARLRWVVALILLMVYSSRRFDDIQHSWIRQDESGIAGFTYKSKTDRFGRGIAWLVTNASVSGVRIADSIWSAWLDWQQLAPAACKDYLWPAADGSVAAYDQALLDLRLVLSLLGFGMEYVRRITLHVPRHTMISWVADLGYSAAQLQQLGSWKSVESAVGYIERSFSQVVTMVTHATQAVRDNVYCPGQHDRDFAQQELRLGSVPVVDDISTWVQRFEEFLDLAPAQLFSRVQSCDISGVERDRAPGAVLVEPVAPMAPGAALAEAPAVAARPAQPRKAQAKRTYNPRPQRVASAPVDAKAGPSAGSNRKRRQ